MAVQPEVENRIRSSQGAGRRWGWRVSTELPEGERECGGECWEERRVVVMSASRGLVSALL